MRISRQPANSANKLKMLYGVILSLFVFINVVRCQDENVINTTPRSSNNVNELTGEKEEEHMQLYQKIHSFLIKTKVYRNFTLQDTIHHVQADGSWTPTKEMQNKFPYYQSGHDYEDQPVWVMEVGKYNYREQIEKGPEGAHNLTLYLYQAIHNILGSMLEKDTPEREIRGIFLIGDCEGLDLLQIAHLPTMSFVLNLLRTYSDFVGLLLGHAVFINMNYATTALFNAFRPILGGVFNRMELYGTNKAKWKTALHKALPVEAIPSWYGGRKDYKPLKVYG